MKRVAILTGGGDCPGLNAVIRCAVRKLYNNDVETVGVLEGWKGLIEGLHKPLHVSETDDILHIGGTILGSSRTNPFKKPEVSIPRIKENMKRLNIDALIAIGGDDTLGAAAELYEKEGIPTVGVPKTIDNDLHGTDFCFGFYTAVERAMECFDWLRDTARSHRRCVVVECMGRHAGWITAFAGMAAACDYILVPEKDADIDDLCETLKRNRALGKLYNLVAVSEAVKLGDEYVLQTAERDDFGNVRLGGVGQMLAKIIQEKTGIETRSVVLGHLQRGGSPTAYDRILGTRYGMAAAQLVINKDFGKMVALKGNDIVAIEIGHARSGYKMLDMDLFALAEEFFK
ncbi:MAG: 6-phosphofructokinase [Planctomycetota bacterium]|nr:MAG: 6-phosphofructokinase [Planctomycetota bacterium]